MSTIEALLGLQGRNFVLMGGGAGLGLAIAEKLNDAGARILCLDRDLEMAKLVADRTGAIAWQADAHDRASLGAAFDEAAHRLGSVDGIVDLIGLARAKPLPAFSDQDWAFQFDIIIRHAFLALQLGSERMTDGGSFTFVGSLSGERAVRHQVVYGAAKAALHNLVRGAAQEFGERGLRVNVVAPGFIRTPRLEQMLSVEQWKRIESATPLGRAADPADIAGSVLFMASRLASMVTGQVLLADGGLSAIAALPHLDWPKPATTPVT